MPYGFRWGIDGCEERDGVAECERERTEGKGGEMAGK